MLKEWNKGESRETYRLFKNFQDYEHLVDINAKNIGMEMFTLLWMTFFYFIKLFHELYLEFK